MKDRTFRIHLAASTVAAAVLTSAAVPAGMTAAADDLLAKSRAAYAALKSYSDTGVVETFSTIPGGAPIKERHTFTTFYRAPRHYYFDFNEDKSAGGDRYVIWGDNEAFHTWWATTGAEEEYPKGQGSTAFALAATPTKWAALQIAPLVFAQAGLKGPLVNVDQATVDGVEDLGGRKCHKLSGVARSVYAETGRGEQARKTTIWIDAETLMVRKVFEDTPKGALPGSAERVTTSFQPQANPSLDDSKFKFTAPVKKTE